MRFLFENDVKILDDIGVSGKGVSIGVSVKVRSVIF